jgi:3-deoxy-7-phosphoheptulonate synthase
LDAVLKKLATRPPLIYAGEAASLKASLAAAARGEAFVVQAGDCAETFQEFSPDQVKNFFKVILQMAVVLTWSSGVPTIKIGRIAGQFAKPRTSETEVVAGETLNVYRGDMVNSADADARARVPNPENMLRAYDQSASTLNLLRAFAGGGFADLASVHQWNREFVAASTEGQRYEAVAQGIDSALRFMRACGIDSRALHEVEMFTSHEALVLDYEQALTRQDSMGENVWYDCSTHMPWIGTRTKGLDGAHVEFLSGVANPIGCKVDAETTPDDVLGLCEKLNPGREQGRLTLISRMGKNHVRSTLPGIIRAVRDAGHPVLWMCDPMHGNTFKLESGLKTRRFGDVFEEISEYFAVHRDMGTWPGGIHVELTGDNVTECLGGPDDIVDEDLATRYMTACDPRLNASQSIDLAFRVAELLDDRR